MSKRPYYKHCKNCRYCSYPSMGLFCTLKHNHFYYGRLRALFCRFFEQRKYRELSEEEIKKLPPVHYTV